MNTRTAPLDLAQFEGHTPGPWIIDGNGAGVVYINSTDGYVAVLANRNDGIDNAARQLEAAHNGNLLAAAPALLAECKRQREQIAALAGALYAATRSSPCVSIHCRHYDLANGQICHIEAANKVRAVESLLARHFERYHSDRAQGDTALAKVQP